MGKAFGAIGDGLGWAAKTIVSAPGYGLNKDPAPAPTPLAASSPTPTAPSAPTAPTPGLNPTPAHIEQMASTPKPAGVDMGAGEGWGGESPNNITRTGNSYTGGPGIKADGLTINGRAVSPGGAPSEVNQAAAQTLSDRSSAGLGFQSASLRTAEPAQQPGGALSFGTADTRVSDYNRFARDANMNTALSRMSPGGRARVMLGMRGQDIGQDIETGRGQNAMAQTTMRESGDTQRLGIREAGDNQRAQLRESGETGRFNAANQVAQGRLELERTAAGFGTRAAAEQEKLRSVLTNPGSSPEQRQQAQQALLAMSGHQAPNRFTVVGGGQEFDSAAGGPVKRPDRVFNNQTGQFVEQQPAASAMPPGMTRQVGTSGGKPVYEDGNGKRFIGG